MADKTFTYLHLSDLHSGMVEQAVLWPNVKQRLFEDLPILLDKTGPLDAVIFTGDIAFSGDAIEFDRVTTILLEIFECLDKKGCAPSFVAIPGNHDLVRPDAKSSSAMMLRRWW